jgi:hypothetical protein
LPSLGSSTHQNPNCIRICKLIRKWIRNADSHLDSCADSYVYTPVKVCLHVIVRYGSELRGATLSFYTIYFLSLAKKWVPPTLTPRNSQKSLPFRPPNKIYPPCHMWILRFLRIYGPMTRCFVNAPRIFQIFISLKMVLVIFNSKNNVKLFLIPKIT